MKLLFENETELNISPELLKLFEEAVLASLKYEGFSDNVEVGLTLTNNEEIRSLNSKYRGIDRPTDVLSFPMIDFGNESPDFSGRTVPLGDIVISVERAKEQAADYGHSLERELGFLTVHSMLHLMGYDHMTEQDEKEMFFKQREILDKMGLKR